jgi:hypothetical protein
VQSTAQVIPSMCCKVQEGVTGLSYCLNCWDLSTGVRAHQASFMNSDS